MDILIFIAVAGLLLCAVGALLIWAFSALCRLLAAFVSEPSDTPAP
ncbi:TPA: hypothetical protein ACGCNR_002131 [Stenotrophomonas maltophilia]|nr:hypothetical protein [Stenotrophomonas maltophilia]